MDLDSQGLGPSRPSFLGECNPWPQAARPVLGLNFETEGDRSVVRLQVVAGPRNHERRGVSGRSSR